jgi:hypothetical protein
MRTSNASRARSSSTIEERKKRKAELERERLEGRRELERILARLEEKSRLDEERAEWRRARLRRPTVGLLGRDREAA